MTYLSEWQDLIYQRDPAAWIDHYVLKNELNKPFHLYDHQREVLRLAFDFDEAGELPWDTIIWSCVKKSGKTTMLAALSLWWAMCQEPPNEVLLIANDLEQVTSRAYASIIRLLRYNPTIDPLAVITQREIRFSNDTIIRPIASEYSGAAGSNHGWCGFDELWAYTSERARRLFDELTNVPTRLNSPKFIATYAGFESESELLRSLYLKGVDQDEHKEGQGERIHPDLPIFANREARLFAYWDHEPRMPWQTPRYYASQRGSLRPSAYTRFHENRWSASSETFITPELWDHCVDYDHHPLLPTREVQLCVGVDASLKHDSSAVVAVGFAEIGERTVIALAQHRIWQPSPDEPLDIEETIEAYLRELHEHYRVEKVLVDPWQMADMCSRLLKARLRIEMYPQTTGNLTRLGTAMLDVLRGRNLLLYPAVDLRQHAMSTVAVESSRGWRIAKERSSQKIDGIIALGMALIAALDLQPSLGRRFLPVED